MAHAIITGPINVPVFLADGTEVDVRPDVVYVDTPEQAAEVAHLIGEYHVAPTTPEHPLFVGQEANFEYVPPEEFKGYQAHESNVFVESGN